MENILVVGDIAGQYDAFQKLLAGIPLSQRKRIICVGDLIDRGPKPIEVVDFVKNNCEAIYGNHEDMFVDYFRGQGRYDEGLWRQYNGGQETFEAYTKDEESRTKLQEHLAWIEKLPWYIETDNFFISHGIWSQFSDLQQAQVPFERGRGAHNLIWNRDNLGKRDKFQIYGHNGHVHKTDYSICIDGQRDGNGFVCAYNTASKIIYKQGF
jgi:serine/threonine protein phosphatase 1